MRLAFTILLAACHAAPVTATNPPPPPRAASSAAPVGFRPTTSCVTASSAGVLVIVLAADNCDLWRFRRSDLVVVLPLDTSHPLPPRLCRHIVMPGRAFIGDETHPAVVTGGVCADLLPTSLLGPKGTVDFDLVVDGERVRGAVPLAELAAGD